MEFLIFVLVFVALFALLELLSVEPTTSATEYVFPSAIQAAPSVPPGGGDGGMWAEIHALRADYSALSKDVKAILKAVSPAKPEPADVVKSAIELLSTAF